jgi:DNA polymerase-3 subunit epsilon
MRCRRCWATATPQASLPPLGAWLEQARKASARIWAGRAVVGSGGVPKVWWKDVDEAAADGELAYLWAEVYQNAELDLPCKRFTGLHRFSTRSKRLGPSLDKPTDE